MTTPIDRRRNSVDESRASNLRRQIALSDSLLEKYPDNDNMVARNKALKEEFDAIQHKAKGSEETS